MAAIRIVVADDATALLYDITHRSELRSPLHVSEHLSDPAAHLHDRDLVTDKPGRKSDRTPLQGGRRGATARHATGPEHQAHTHETQQFALRIAHALAGAAHGGTIDQLVLVCAPRFLGVLRAALPPPVSALVIDEIHKDLTHQRTLLQILRNARDYGLVPEDYQVDALVNAFAALQGPRPAGGSSVPTSATVDSDWTAAWMNWDLQFSTSLLAFIDDLLRGASTRELPVLSYPQDPMVSMQSQHSRDFRAPPIRGSCSRASSRLSSSYAHTGLHG